MNPSPFPMLPQRIYPVTIEQLCCKTIAPIQPNGSQEGPAHGPLVTLKDNPLKAAQTITSWLFFPSSPYFPRPRNGPEPVGTPQLLCPLQAQARNCAPHVAQENKAPFGPPPNHLSYRFDHECCGGPDWMFIENVIAMCDRIMRRTAEENPAATSLQENPAEVSDNRNTAPKAGEFGLMNRIRPMKACNGVYTNHGNRLTNESAHIDGSCYFADKVIKSRVVPENRTKEQIFRVRDLFGRQRETGN
jgi:hypothetical protein